MYIIKLISEVRDDVRSEIREEIQEVKDHFNKEIEILKRMQKSSKLKNQQTKLKIQWKVWAGREPKGMLGMPGEKQEAVTIGYMYT